MPPTTKSRWGWDDFFFRAGAPVRPPPGVRKEVFCLVGAIFFCLVFATCSCVPGEMFCVMIVSTFSSYFLLLHIFRLMFCVACTAEMTSGGWGKPIFSKIRVLVRFFFRLYRRFFRYLGSVPLSLRGPDDRPTSCVCVLTTTVARTPGKDFLHAGAQHGVGRDAHKTHIYLKVLLLFSVCTPKKFISQFSYIPPRRQIETKPHWRTCSVVNTIHTQYSTR